MTQKPISIDILMRMPRRSIGIRITDEGLLEVRAPRLMPIFLINRFVESHRDWIIRTKNHQKSRLKTTMQSYNEGRELSLAGKKYVLHVTDGNAIVIAGSRIFFPKKFTTHPKTHMESFLRTFAKKFLTERVSYYAKKMGVSWKRISIRDTKSRWGSCSSSGTISFSYRLVLADVPIIEYVVIHELAHVTHHHHKPIFWDRVGEFYPEYKTARTWLQKHGHTLHI